MSLDTPGQKNRTDQTEVKKAEFDSSVGGIGCGKGRLKQIGKKRQNDICSLVDELVVLSREQVQSLVFGPGDYPAKKCRETLLKLVKREELRRGRTSITDSYVYWQRGRKPAQIDHTILLNWVYVAAKKAPNWWSLKDWQTKGIKCGNILVPDGFMVLRNIQKDKAYPFYIEAQRIDNKSVFDKVKKYTDYFKSGEWHTPEWPGGKQFAGILVITDGFDTDKRRLEGIIQKENSKNLRFTVTTIDELINNFQGVILRHE